IEICTSGLGDPEMWISVDGFEVIRVMNLHWRFRGNENLSVNEMPVQIFWDVHDWLFNSSGTTGHGLFIFKPGELEEECTCASVGDGCNGNDGGRHDLPPERPSKPEFCHVIYAWKFE